MVKEQDKAMILQHVKNNTLKVLVRPDSSKTRVVMFDVGMDHLKIELKASAQDNKANVELIKFLSRMTGMEAKIILGQTSKKKVVRFS